LTSPGPDDTTRRLNTAASAVGADKPSLAVTLARSDLSDSEIGAVGGFTNALQIATARRLAANSGARVVGLSAQEKNGQAAIGDPVEDPAEHEDDSRSWFEKATDAIAGALSNTGNFLIHNPVSDAIFEGAGLPRQRRAPAVPAAVGRRGHREQQRDRRADEGARLRPQLDRVLPGVHV
jgi:hypothetical protein